MMPSHKSVILFKEESKRNITYHFSLVFQQINESVLPPNPVVKDDREVVIDEVLIVGHGYHCSSVCDVSKSHGEPSGKFDKRCHFLLEKCILFMSEGNTSLVSRICQRCSVRNVFFLSGGSSQTSEPLTDEID